ncbi:MAG: hypothetical protein ABIP68_03865 [Ferruginibacter sp.]
MKKLVVFVAAAMLFTGSAFACEGGKDGKKCKKDKEKKSCCSKDKKSCDKSKDKEKKTAKL